MLSTLETNYKPILKELFSKDEELLSIWHIAAGSGLEGCVDRTFNDMRSFGPTFKFFKVEQDNKLIGYFGIETIGPMRFLTGFFLDPAHRNKESIKEYWNLVQEHFDNKPFLVGLYSKNSRAINFLKRQNGKVLIDNGTICSIGFNMRRE